MKPGIYMIAVVAILAVISWQFGTMIPVAEEEAPAPGPQAEVLAPGWGELDFTPPEVGTYALPQIKKAAGGEILLSNGDEADLSDLIGDKAVLLSFIYTSCSDVNGCPLSTFVMHKMNKTLKENTSMNDDIRLITLSFDPERDTPDAMKSYGSDFKSNSAVEWVFATTHSQEQLDPILDDYGQFVFKVVEKAKEGEAEKVNFAHVLKSFLIDKQGYIRNIYSVSYLHPDIVLNDIKTILQENSPQASG